MTDRKRSEKRRKYQLPTFYYCPALFSKAFSVNVVEILDRSVDEKF